MDIRSWKVPYEPILFDNLELYRKLYQKIKLKKQKIKFAAIFCVCWFAVLVFLVDGVLKFQTLVDYSGSYVLVEITLLLLVILPTLAVYRLTKERKTMSKREYIQANKDWLEAKSKGVRG
jgi:hypothetical protein